MHPVGEIEASGMLSPVVIVHTRIFEWTVTNPESLKRTKTTLIPSVGAQFCNRHMSSIVIKKKSHTTLIGEDGSKLVDVTLI